MGKKFKELQSHHIDFITTQHMFFVGTAATEGRINVSPKGMDTLSVVDNNTIVWLNLTGSGNETAAHLLMNDRMTIMFCSFGKKPLILRLYGHADIFHRKDEEYQNYISMFPSYLSARQIIKLKVDMVQTSCGFGVPIMQFEGIRPLMNDWAQKKGEDGIKAYWEEKNQFSIDGFETKIMSKS